MEWAIEKCVELGAARIVPVVAQRTEAHLASRGAKAGGTLAAHCPPGFRAVAPGLAAGNLAAGQASTRQLTAATGTRIVLAESEEQMSC